MPIRLITIKYITLVVLLTGVGGLKAQETTAIDTSEYLPLFYDGALEYNLIVAASNGYTSEVERLIGIGAEVDAKTAQGVTPLIFAVINRQAETAKVLIKYDADVNQVTTEYETPLMIAVKNNDLETAEVLVRYGADVDFQERHGVTPLNYASIYGFFYIVDLLIYYRADIDKKAYDGTTPLMAAIWAGNEEVADLLIQNGANMEARDEDGFTPFLIAAQNGDTLMLNLLRRKGVNIYETNFNKWDALALAIKSDKKPAVETLLKAGNNWASSENNAVNPYYISARYRRKEIMTILEQYNVPSKYKTDFDESILGVSVRFNQNDFLSGFSIKFKEPLTSLGLVAGMDAKLWYTRVIVKENEHLFKQYFDKCYVVYTGVFKDYQLTNNIFGSNFFLTGSLSAAYSFGNEFKGTNVSVPAKFRIMPAVSLRYSKRNFSVFTGAEYLKTEFYKGGPLWARIGCSYNFSFDSIKDRSKDIKWY